MVLLNNRYMYYEKDFLGEGSYGKLYKGKDTRNQEEVAIKSKNHLLYIFSF